MFSAATLAQISDNLIYSAIAVYLLAMLAYASVFADRAATRARRVRPVLEGVGGPAVSTTGAAMDAPDVDHGPGSGSGSSAADTSTGRMSAIASALTVLGGLLHLASVLSRAFAAQRAPWGNMYEFAVVMALAAVATFLVLLRREPVKALGVWVTAMVALTLGLAVTVLYTPAGALVPVLDSYWLVIHVAAAITSGGVFALGAVATIAYRWQLRSERRGPVAQTTSGQLPSSTTLHRVAHTAHLFAFPVWTFAVIAGAIWAENSWGRYWGWDPKETWAFITWVLYAAYLHAEATVGWRGPKASWFALAGFAAFIFNFFGVNMWITGLHSYAGI